MPWGHLCTIAASPEQAPEGPWLSACAGMIEFDATMNGCYRFFQFDEDSSAG
jgi:hypothetical protein